MRRPLALLLVVGACLAAPAPARAYIMPAEAIAHLWGERRAVGWREASLRLWVRAGGEEAAPTEARLQLKRPERARWQAQERRHHPVLDVEGRRRGGQGAHMEDDWRPSPSLWLSWLLPRGRRGDDVAPRLLAALKRFGVDPEKVALGRFQGDVVYIIGAAAGDLAPPQIWLDRDRLLPVRTLVDVPAAEVAELLGDPDDPAVAGGQAAAAGRGGLRLDTRLIGWAKEASAPRLPTAWEFWLGDRLLARWEVRHARLDARLPDALFTWPRARPAG